MRRRNLFNAGQRPVLSTPHGGTVHHSWDWVVHHKLLVETGALVLGLILLLGLTYVIQTGGLAARPVPLPNAAEAYRALHSYDAIENLRALRLVNPRPVADRSYDDIENLRAQRLLLQGDRSYDAIEELRALRLINPLPVADHSYDAIEEIRATRDLGR